jgi:hypothetical protein
MRLMESSELDTRYKNELRKRKAEQNPVVLNRKLNKAVERLLQINQKKDILTGNERLSHDTGK